MDVVFHPADLVHEDLMLVADARETPPQQTKIGFVGGPGLCPRPGLLFFGNELAAVFCTEHDVQKILDERVRQWICPPEQTFYEGCQISVSRLKALIPAVEHLPTATPWANLLSRLKALKHQSSYRKKVF